MNRVKFLILFSCLYLIGHSQKEDYSWVLGYGELNKVKFTESSYNISIVEPDSIFRLYITNAAISDSLGNLLLFTSGTDIYDKNGNIIENGDSLNLGFIRDFWYPLGYNATNGAIFLNSFAKDEYYVFHLRGDTISDLDPSLNNGFGTNLFYTRVKRNSSDGFEVLEKNVAIISDTLKDNGVTACRHGNGRDWWLMVSEGGSNCYYTLLMTPDTIELIHKQCMGVKSGYIGGGQTLFSQDGTMYIRGSDTDGVEIFDFDRCSGLLSNSKAPLIGVPEQPYGYLAVSPNGRFLYITMDTKLYQMDLNASDIYNSKIEIDDIGSIPFSYGYSTFQLAPDGKIYSSNGSAAKWHIIHYPDELGQACNLEIEVPLLKEGSFGLPNFPNYRLGRLIGSDCDTVYTSITNPSDPNSNVKVFPNPSSGKIRVEYGDFLWTSQDELSLNITNVLGQVVYQTELPPYSLYQDLYLNELSIGLYQVQIYNQRRLVGMERFIIEN